MSEPQARSILRIIGLTTVLIGAILTTTSVFTLIGLDASAAGSFENLAPMAQAVVWSHASIILWGLLLCSASTALARGRPVGARSSARRPGALHDVARIRTMER